MKRIYGMMGAFALAALFPLSGMATEPKDDETPKENTEQAEDNGEIARGGGGGGGRGEAGRGNLNRGDFRRGYGYGDYGGGYVGPTDGSSADPYYNPFPDDLQENSIFNQNQRRNPR